MVHKKGHTDR